MHLTIHFSVEAIVPAIRFFWVGWEVLLEALSIESLLLKAVSHMLLWLANTLLGGTWISGWKCLSSEGPFTSSIKLLRQLTQLPLLLIVSSLRRSGKLSGLAGTLKSLGILGWVEVVNWAQFSIKRILHFRIIIILQRSTHIFLIAHSIIPAKLGCPGIRELQIEFVDVSRFLTLRLFVDIWPYLYKHGLIRANISL